MRESVKAGVVMSFVVSEELSFLVPVEIQYQSGEPYAVRMTFHLPGDPPLIWVFGRELLFDGIHRPSGEGDVRIAPIVPSTPTSPAGPEGLPDVGITLQVGRERALFRASAAPLLVFLDRTDELVPLGQESAYGRFDSRLEEALGRILAEENAG
ncbi:SsgA family sporulation/cell division regulator [Streptomyces sp. NPDC052236]|uniref:SsgA family sporulation/cell division regulator n=1 Tax=Streptomyces sp. NPDC052236 TaxID=3365686 RepID=UPI0037D75EAE